MYVQLEWWRWLVAASASARIDSTAAVVRVDVFRIRLTANSCYLPWGVRAVIVPAPSLSGSLYRYILTFPASVDNTKKIDGHALPVVDADLQEVSFGATGAWCFEINSIVSY